MNSFFDEEDINVYVIETINILDGLEEIFLEAEKANNMNLKLDKAIRNFHTIKGNSMTIEANEIAILVNVIENLLCGIRDKKIYSYETDKIVDLLLDNIDFLRDSIRSSNFRCGKTYIDEKIKAINKYILMNMKVEVV